MGLTAEQVAKDFSVTRDEQDAFSVESHNRALAALKNGTFKEDIVPITVKEVLLLMDWMTILTYPHRLI